MNANNKIKQYLKQIPLINKFLRFKNRTRLWLRDVSSALLAKKTKMKLTPFGFKLIGSNSIHHISMQEGTFEPEEIALFQNLLQNAEVFVDVGANIGFYSCLARFAGKHVIAVEPSAKNLDYLYVNVQANDWTDVEVFPVGLSNRPGLASLYGGSSTGASLIGNWAGSSKFFHSTVSLTTLDIILGTRLSGKKLFIKVDVEGYEYNALLGSVNVMQMKPQPTWVVEICLNEFHPDGINPYYKETFELFWQNGYSAYTADHRNRLIQPADVDRWVNSRFCDSGTINYKFVPLS